jgi:hypothetical protein
VSTYTFDHLLAMSTDIGTFEHAQLGAPRTEHGYCTDDMARVLLVISREPFPLPPVVELGRVALTFLLEAQHPNGMVHNRRDTTGSWLDEPNTEDCWGRSLWGLGTAARRFPSGTQRRLALAGFGRGAQQRSAWPRAMAFAALGAAEIVERHPRHLAARAVLRDAANVIAPLEANSGWPWPEPRLTYANATLPEALIAVGTHLERADLVDHGLRLLGWLLDRETLSDHLSPTPVGGSGPSDAAPAFDQQPIEVASLADACRRAFAVTEDPRWLSAVEMAVRWFDGDNDAGTPMAHPTTGGGYDGLHANGPNLNQGCESTLALIATRQLAAENN